MLFTCKPSTPSIGFGQNLGSIYIKFWDFKKNWILMFILTFFKQLMIINDFTGHGWIVISDLFSYLRINLKNGFILNRTHQICLKKEINFSVLLFEKNHDMHLSSGVLHYYEWSRGSTLLWGKFTNNGICISKWFIYRHENG